MKKLRLIVSLCVASVVAATSMLLFQGCEDQPDTNIPEISDPVISDRGDSPRGGSDYNWIDVDPTDITPEYVGQQFALKANGNDVSFSWSVNVPSAGSVQVQRDNTVAIYTVLNPTLDNQIIVKDGSGRTAIIDVTP